MVVVVGGVIHNIWNSVGFNLHPRLSHQWTIHICEGVGFFYVFFISMMFMDMQRETVFFIWF